MRFHYRRAIQFLDLGWDLKYFESLVEQYGCAGVGIDQIDPDFMQKSNKSITFINGDVDHISDYQLKPTVTLSVDSLYFCKDLDALVRDLCSLSSNRMYLFYSQYLFDENEGDKSILQKDHTRIADILKQNGVSYEAIDFSENERRLYEKSLIALKSAKKRLHTREIRICFQVAIARICWEKQLYETGRACRFLYIVK
jgi:hypothetical protein